MRVLILFLLNSDVVTNPIMRFELLKIIVKTNTIEFCTKKNNDLNAKELNLIDKLDQLNTKIVNGDHSFELLNELEKSKKKLLD